MSGVAVVEVLRPRSSIPANVVAAWEPSVSGTVRKTAHPNARAAIAWARERAPRIALATEYEICARRHVEVDGALVEVQAPIRVVRLGRSIGVEPVAAQVFRDLGAVVLSDDQLGGLDVGASARLANDVGHQPIDEVYGGLVVIEEPVPQYGARLSIYAYWTDIFDGETFVREYWGPRVRDELERGVAWARERTAHVLVSSGPPDYRYWSAGEADIAALRLPAWRPDERVTERASGVTSSRNPRPAGKQFPFTPLVEDWLA
jgi:hypothetical protein